MSTFRSILAIFVVFILVSCSISTPTTTPAPKPTATPLPLDVPIYQNSFEGITDLATSGITSNGEITLNTQNFNYPGPGTALEINGALPGAQYSSLHVDFSIRKMTGEKGLDLSNKTIYYSAFIPADSAIDNISVYAGKGGAFTIIAGINADDYWTKGAWHNYRFVLPYAAGMLGYFDTIRIAGQRNQSSGDEVNASFLVDDLRWIGVDVNNIPLDDTVESLRKYTTNLHFKFGLFADPRNIVGDENDPFKNRPWVVFEDPWVAYLRAQEGSVNAIWGFSFGENEDLSLFDYDRPDDIPLVKMYKNGIGNSMTTLGYGIGCTNFYVPQWLHDLPYPDDTRVFLLHLVEKNLRFTKGQNPIWILFNEFIIANEYGGNGLKYRQTALSGLNHFDFGVSNYYMPWADSPSDSSLIEAAFIKAHEVDPEATLLLNDAGGVEQIGLPRSDFLFQLASSLKAKGIPIDGVGFQLHNIINPDGGIRYYVTFSWPWEFDSWDMTQFLDNVDRNVKRYASVGLKVAFTEVNGYIKIDDLDLTTPEGRASYKSRLQWQAKYYAGLLKIAMENENVILYHTWGVTDRWPDALSDMSVGYGDMLLFDKNFHPKPAYWAMLELLKGQ